MFLFALAGTAAPAVAAGSGISSVTQSYNAGPSVVAGMAVEFKPKDQTTVTPLTEQDIRNMQGVVIPTNDAALVLTPQSTSARQVLVAATGRYDLLVSNQNGSVKTGDYVAMSALPGIGMKAGTNQPEVIGRAAGNFSGTDNVISTMSLKQSFGRSTSVAIGQIPVDVRLEPNPLFRTNNLPGFLNRAANSVVNKPGSIRIYLSIAVLLATFFISGTMFYSGVRNSIVAVGRNPLAKRVINRNLAQAIVAGLAIFLAGVLTAYLILI